MYELVSKELSMQLAISNDFHFYYDIMIKTHDLQRTNWFVQQEQWMVYLLIDIIINFEEWLCVKLTLLTKAVSFTNLSIVFCPNCN